MNPVLSNTPGAHAISGAYRRQRPRHHLRVVSEEEDEGVGRRAVRPGAVAVRGPGSYSEQDDETEYDNLYSRSDDDYRVFNDGDNGGYGHAGNDSRIHQLRNSSNDTIIIDMEPVDAVVVDEDECSGNENEHQQQNEALHKENTELGGSSSTATWSEDIVDGANGDVTATTSNVRASSNSLASITFLPFVVTGKRVSNQRIAIYVVVGSLIILVILATVLVITFGLNRNDSGALQPIRDSQTIAPSTQEEEKSEPTSIVYSSSSSWTQFGQNILGNFHTESTGTSVDLNSDGKIVAISSGVGPVRVMKFNNTESHTDDDSSRMNGGAAPGDWIQLGRETDIIPDLPSYSYVSLNDHGNIMVIGKGPPSYRISLGFSQQQPAQYGNFTGRVQVFQYVSDSVDNVSNLDDPFGDWRPLGQELTGERGGWDEFGCNVKLSADAKVLVVASIGSVGKYSMDEDENEYTIDSSSTVFGHLHVYRYSELLGSWQELGNLVEFNAGVVKKNRLNYHGYSFALSGNGRTVSVREWQPTPSSELPGTTHVTTYGYRDETDTWNKVGQSIESENGGVDFAGALELSNDGRVLAIGEKFNDNDNGIDAGRVRVFELLPKVGASAVADKEWVQMGQDVKGDVNADLFGTSVSLSGDGLRLGVGAIGTVDSLQGGTRNVGYGRVLEYDGDDWIRIGDDVKCDFRLSNGAYGYGAFGSATAISSDGSTFAVSAPRSNGLVRSGGRVRIFQEVNK